MKRNPDATCETCPYWRQNETNDHVGDCRRYAPRGVWREELPQVAVAWGFFPALRAARYWCGEHPDFWLEESGEVEECS